ncbi:phosphotransferase [archaeon]|jgi:homoserine kinase type II|nr:phosphotransferase [archaeon]MBT7101967.1 phosphotransferase [archaeon]
MRIKKKDFIEVLDGYNIGRYKSHKYLEDTLENDVYILFTTQGKFILKFLSNIDLKDFKEQLGFIDFLYNKKLPVVKNIKNKVGSEIVEYSKSKFIIQKFVEGVHPKGFNNSLIKDISKAIGKMHKVLLSSEFTKSKKHKYKKRTFGDGVDKKIINNIQNKLLKNLDKINFKDLKVARIHGDLSEVNMIVGKNKLNAFIDFDDSDYDYLVYELAIFIAHSFIRSDIIYWDKIKLFLDGYQKYVKLNDEEMRSIYYLIKYRLLGILYWYFKYINKYPKRRQRLNKGIERSYNRIINFEKINNEGFMEELR